MWEVKGLKIATFINFQTAGNILIITGKCRQAFDAGSIGLCAFDIAPEAGWNLFFGHCKCGTVWTYKKNVSRKEREEIRKTRKLQITGLTIFARFALLVNLYLKRKF